MATSQGFVEFVCEQIGGIGDVRYRKMFGEYMVYLNDKPILLICNDTVFVKIKGETTELLADSEKDTPYNGAKEHYVLDIDNAELCREVAVLLERITPLPKPKKPKKSSKYNNLHR